MSPDTRGFFRMRLAAVSRNNARLESGTACIQVVVVE